MGHLSSYARLLVIACMTAVAFSALIPRRPTNATPHILLPLPDKSCFSSNPDIAGIGVRVSTYVQSLLLSITIFVFVQDGNVDSHEQKTLEKIYTNVLITACALLFSAVPLASQNKLSIYHALILLNFSWMLIANALIVCMLPTINTQSKKTTWLEWMMAWRPSEEGQIPAILLVSIHFTAMGALAIYVWLKLIEAERPECVQALVFMVSISAARNPIHYASLFFYFIAAIPIVNAVVFNMIAVGVINIPMLFMTYTFMRLYIVTAFLQATATIILIAITEFMIQANRHLVADAGEAEWGFGQVLALILMVVPLFEFVDVWKTKISKPYMSKTSFYLRKSLLNSEKSVWERVHPNATIASVLTYLQSQAQNSAFTATINTMTAAKTCLEAVNQKIQICQKSVPDITDLETAKREVSMLYQNMCEVCELRFPDIKDPASFRIVKAYLEAAKNALAATKNALEARDAETAVSLETK